MKVTVDMVGRGVKDGLRTTWELAKVIIPVYFLITVLKYTPLMDLMVKAFEPVTKLVGLPGEAALPIVIANLLTIYPAIPAIIAFPLLQRNHYHLHYDSFMSFFIGGGSNCQTGWYHCLEGSSLKNLYSTNSRYNT